MIHVESKTARQLVAFIKNIDSHCTRDYRLLKIGDFDKDVEAKKSPPLNSINYTSKQSSHPGLSAHWQNKNTLGHINIAIVDSKIVS